MEKYILTIDQGTTGTTILLLDSQAEIFARGYSEIKQYFPKQGWVEHDLVEIWAGVKKIIREILQSNNLTPNQIAAIAITNQRETTALWDVKSGQPVHKAIVWQCRRTESICENLNKMGAGDLIRSKTGLIIDPYFSGTKIKWLFDNIDGLRKKAESGEIKFGTIDSWLLWNITGGKVHATDYTNASRTMIFNVVEKQWDDELTDLLGIPPVIFPEVKNSKGIFGYSDPASLLGIEAPVTGIAGDQQAALFGHWCIKPGEIKNTYGTGCFLMINVGDNIKYSKHKLLTTLACDSDGSPIYAFEGSIFIAGALIQWLRDNLHLITHASETEKLAQTVKDNGGVYIIPAFAGLGAPYWDMKARGAILGLTRGVKKEHIIRASLEAIAYETKDVIEAIRLDLAADTSIKKLKVDGGASANDFLMQFQADILGIPVQRPKQIETTALGAGYLAGLAIGFYDKEEIGSRFCKIDRIFEPKMPVDQAEKLYNDWKIAIERVKTS